jgi:hypothetical protein
MGFGQIICRFTFEFRVVFKYIICRDGFGQRLVKNESFLARILADVKCCRRTSVPKDEWIFA